MTTTPEPPSTPDAAGEPPRAGLVVRFVRRYPWHVAVMFMVVFLAAIRPTLRHVPDPPKVLYQLPAFSLVDQDGEAFTNETMRGRVWVAGFIFTTCPSVCPKITQSMIELQQRYLEHGIDVTLVSFTVDPAKDTPEVLRAYADDVAADQQRWRFVTGDVKAARTLVIEGFKLPAKPEPVKEDGTYDIIHATRLALVDGDGGVRGFYETNEMGLDEIFHRSQHIIRESRRR